MQRVEKTKKRHVGYCVYTQRILSTGDLIYPEHCMKKREMSEAKSFNMIYFSAGVVSQKTAFDRFIQFEVHLGLS